MERSRLLLYLGVWDYIQKSLNKAERDAADAYAGPDKSFPLYVNGKHLAAAWDLAGRADNPEEVRRNILAFARKHNLMHLLPLSAQHAAGVMDITRKSFPDGEWPDIDQAVLEKMLAMPAPVAQQVSQQSAVKKATRKSPPIPSPESVEPAPADATSDTPALDADAVDDAAEETSEEPDADDTVMRQMMGLMEQMASGSQEHMNALRQFATAHGIAGMLTQKARAPASPVSSPAPESKHVVLDGDDGIPVAKSMLVTKSWSDPRTGDVYIEGWVSTEARDQQRDIVPPESFSRALPEYMARYAPLTTEHQLFPNIKKGELTRYPVGHMQRIALVRDGQMLQESVHPTDPAEFQHFPGYGTGAYGRGVINEPTAATQVIKGNMAGFSWIGRLKEYDILPDGGKRYGLIEPWLETTLSAFPVNTTARLVASSRATSESTKE